MTPEEKASMPAHPHPMDGENRAALERVQRILTGMRALRVHRHALEYPEVDPERGRLPEIVRRWEAEHGPAPASTSKVLGEIGR